MEPEDRDPAGCADMNEINPRDYRARNSRNKRPIPHKRRVDLILLASQMVENVQAKVEEHERHFFLRQLDTMFEGEHGT